MEVVEERRLASERFLQRALRLPTVVSSSVLLAFLAEEVDFRLVYMYSVYILCVMFASWLLI